MLFVVTADYRPNNPNKPHYYVVIDSDANMKKMRKLAQRKFEDRISWLKVYDVKKVEEQEAEEILKNPLRHTIIR